MIRHLVLLLFSFACTAQPTSHRGELDPAFEKFPFDQWFAERDQARFHWTASGTRAELSFHQRLKAAVEIQLDGRDLETRRGDGELVFLVQIADRDGARYQNHGSIQLNKLDQNIKAANLEYSQSAFFLPGEYRLAVAIVDTVTGEHSTRQAQIRVAPLQEHVLTDAWRDLPAVEFIHSVEPPDSLFLPEIQGRLQWASSVRSPARLTVLLNVAPSVPAPGSRRPQSDDIAALLPTLKAIAQTGSSSVLEHVAILDLSRRRAVFDQKGPHDLDWPRLKASLGEANTASIDIHSLSERHHDAQFFVSQVRSLLRDSEPPCVLAVLTKAVAFESGEDLAPVSLEGLPACRVVYIRYRARVQPAMNPFGREMGRGPGPRMRGPMSRDRLTHDIVDQLESTLKPLRPKVFDVETADQMTRAMAQIEQALQGR